MSCSFCQDACCQYGVDIELPRIEALDRYRHELEPYLGRSRESWFRDDPDDFGIEREPDYPGGAYTRTAVVPLPPERATHNGEACVFLDPADRGCRIHRFAIEKRIDVHEIKPMICLTFPVLHAKGMLLPAEELDEGSLICEGPGQSLYRAARRELEYYFGGDLIAELDRHEASVAENDRQADSGRISLPLGS